MRHPKVTIHVHRTPHGPVASVVMPDGRMLRVVGTAVGAGPKCSDSRVRHRDMLAETKDEVVELLKGTITWERRGRPDVGPKMVERTRRRGMLRG